MIKVPPTKNNMLRIDLETMAEYANSGGTSIVTNSCGRGLADQLVSTDFETRLVLEDLAQFVEDWTADGGDGGGESGGNPATLTTYTYGGA